MYISVSEYIIFLQATSPHVSEVCLVKARIWITEIYFRSEGESGKLTYKRLTDP